MDGHNTQLGTRPQAVLAALLAHANERVSIEALMDAVWGESDRAGSQSTLESHIWRVRQVLEPDRPQRSAATVLVTDFGGYRLVLETKQADSLLFVHLAEQARALVSTDPARALRRCDEALALWRGEPFGASAEAVWAAAAVSRLVEMRDQVRIRRVQALLGSGELERAVVDSCGLTRELPLNEDVWGLRMLALFRAGRPEESLQAYHAARDHILDELGLEPGSRLQELHLRILNQDDELRAPAVMPAAATRPTVNLPRRLPALIGRSVELSALTRLVVDRQLVTVVGAAGCGKTRLAIEVAREAASSFPDGVWCVDLAVLDRSDLVGGVIATTIGLAPAPADPLESQLRDYLRDRRLLLVLDNCEHVAPILYDLLMEVLSDDAAAHVLATSREPISAPGEVTWPLNPLTIPADGSAESSTALELFLTRVREADPTAVIEADARDKAILICDAVDGLPLALELAAARVRTASLSEIVQQVRSDPGGLRRVGGRGDHRRTVRQAIEWSHRLLAPDEQIVHRRLSVLPGGFTRRCAAHVAGFDPLTAGDVADLLESLASKSLLATVRADDPGQESTFRQLATVRAHAATALREAGEVADALASRRDWIRDALTRRPRVGHADDQGWYRALDTDFAAVRATLESTLVDEPDAFAAAILSRISNFWYYSGRMIEARTWLERAIPAPAGTDPVDAAMTTLSLAGIHAMRGRFDLARPLFEGALPQLDQVPQERHADVVEHLASLALVGALHEDFDLVALLARRLHRLAADSDPEFELMAQAVACFAAVASTPPRLSMQRATEIYDRAYPRGVLLACWLCCILIATLSADVGDPAVGLRWNGRLVDVQLRLGARPEAMPIEGRALLVMATGSARRAVELFAASEAQNRRDGIGWPTKPATATAMERACEELGQAGFDAAWSAGLALTPREALGLD